MKSKVIFILMLSILSFGVFKLLKHLNNVSYKIELQKDMTSNDTILNQVLKYKVNYWKIYQSYWGGIAKDSLTNLQIVQEIEKDSSNKFLFKSDTFFIRKKEATKIKSIYKFSHDYPIGKINPILYGNYFIMENKYFQIQHNSTNHILKVLEVKDEMQLKLLKIYTNQKR